MVVLAGLAVSADAAWAACTTATPCAQGPTDVGTLGGSSSYVNAMSSDGSAVVGSAYTSGDTANNAFRWQGGTMTDLGNFGGTFSFANAISSDGSVVVGGGATPGNMGTRAFRWEGGVTTDLGTLGGDNSDATDVSSDGAVVVGTARTLSTVSHAFRWEGGNMTDLGTLGGLYSSASAVSSDGSVVIGQAYLAGNLEAHAFRWQGGAMVDLGTLGGSYSMAAAMSTDGAVVVGTSETTGGAATHPFRWEGGTMIDLGTLGGGDAGAVAVSNDGTVVIGTSTMPGDLTYHAYRWESGSLADLGTLGGDSSQAMAMSSDGSIVVGWALNTDPVSAYRAFRWTAASGMQDLNLLMANAGVNMAGIVLVEARAITPSGEFIAGAGQFGSEMHGFVLRYFDGESGPIGGLTSAQAVRSSLNNLSNARRGVMAQQHGLLSPLLGAERPIEDTNEAGVFAAAGSAAGGGFMRVSTGTGLSLLGGLAYAEENYADTAVKDGMSGALALRYVGAPLAASLQPVLEGGGWITRNAELEFSRIYENGAGKAIGIGTTDGDLSYLYARAGLLYSYGTADQVLATAEIGRERMEVNAYSEMISSSNPFEAHVEEGTEALDLFKLRLSWSHRYTALVDSTLWVAGVRDFDSSSDLQATVPGFGTLTPADRGSTTWVEYGARVGVKLADQVTLDGFVTGVSGKDGIDTRVHGGGALRFQY